MPSNESLLRPTLDKILAQEPYMGHYESIAAFQADWLAWYHAIQRFYNS